MLEEWMEHTAESSKGMVKILIKWAWSDREKLLEQIKLLQHEIKEIDEEKQVTELTQAMLRCLEKIEEEIKLRK